MTVYEMPQLPDELIERVAVIQMIVLGGQGADGVLDEWREAIMKRVAEKERERGRDDPFDQEHERPTRAVKE